MITFWFSQYLNKFLILSDWSLLIIIYYPLEIIYYARQLTPLSTVCDTLCQVHCLSELYTNGIFIIISRNFYSKIFLKYTSLVCTNFDTHPQVLFN